MTEGSAQRGCCATLCVFVYAGTLCDVQMTGSSFLMVPGAIIDRTLCTERPAACRAVEHMYSIDITWP